MTFKPSTTVGEIARQAPLSIRLFDEIKIDYFCEGNKLLAEACRQAGAPLELTLRELNELNNSLVADPDIALWDEASLSELTRHIIETHHEYVRNEIPPPGITSGKGKRAVLQSVPRANNHEA